MINVKVIMKITFPLIQKKIQVYANCHQIMILQNKRLAFQFQNINITFPMNRWKF